MKAEELLYRLLLLERDALVNYVGDPNKITFPTVYEIRSVQPGLLTDTSIPDGVTIPMGFVFGDPTDYEPRTNKNGYPTGRGWIVWDPYTDKPDLTRTLEEAHAIQTARGWTTFLTSLIQHPKLSKYETYYTYFDFSPHLPMAADPDSSAIVLAACVDEEHQAIVLSNVVFMPEEALQGIFGDRRS